MSEAASTQALIQQIATEARSTGKSLVFDPDAPEDAGEADDAPAPAAKPRTVKAPPEEEIPTDEVTEAEDGAEDREADAEDGEEQQAEPNGQVDLEAVKRALTVPEGEDVDMLALAEALGVSPERLKVTGATHHAIRAQRRKAEALVKRALDLGKKLNDQYGDPAKARKAAAAGELEPAISYVENVFGMPWNEINKMVLDLMQGKPPKDLEAKRELRELKRKEAERAEQETKAAEQRARETKVGEAKAWIGNSIKGDKLATPELNKQLSEAGFPTITDLVYEEMQAGWSKGLTDPKKALERVKLKLTKQAKALQSTGLLGKPAAAKPKTTSSKPRANAQTGSAGNGRPMTDGELREAVLKEAGLWRGR